MGYLHIPNLYKDQDIMLYKEAYALEKIHGTSANLTFKEKLIRILSGGESYAKFAKLFDEPSLLKIYVDNFVDTVILYGEAYGGKQQGMSATYGQDLKFVVFDVKIGDKWLDVPNAEEVAKLFGLEFVSYNKIPCTLQAIDAERDADSVQAIRNGIGIGKHREGVVLRPLIEVIKNNGSRIICKHKRDEFRETKTPRVVDEKQMKILKEAEKISREWVTLMRLTHVLDKIKKPHDITKTGEIIKAMLEDIEREGKDEIKMSEPTKKTIGKHTALLYKKLIKGAKNDNKE